MSVVCSHLHLLKNILSCFFPPFDTPFSPAVAAATLPAPPIPGSPVWFPPFFCTYPIVIPYLYLIYTLFILF